jgi:hypothetical protein
LLDTRELPLLLSRRDIPEPDISSQPQLGRGSRGGQEYAVKRKCERADRVRGSLQAVHQAAVREAPQVNEPVASSASKQRLLRVEGHALDHRGVLERPPERIRAMRERIPVEASQILLSWPWPKGLEQSARLGKPAILHGLVG